MRAWPTVLLAALTLCQTPGFASDNTALSAPDFECDLPAFRPSGDATNETRQLRKLEKKYSRCVKTYKSKLRTQRAKVVQLKQQATKTTHLESIEAALTLIDHILASDMKPSSNSPGPDRRDFVDPHHGG